MVILIKYSDETVEYTPGDVKRIIDRAFRKGQNGTPFSEEIDKKFSKVYRSLNGGDRVVEFRTLVDFVSAELVSRESSEIAGQFRLGVRGLD